MYYSIIPNYAPQADRERQIILANKLNSKIYNHFSIKLFKKNNFEGIFFTDEIRTIDLIKIIFICLINKKIKIIAQILELYSISIMPMIHKNSLIAKYSGYKFSIFYEFFKAILVQSIRIILFRLFFNVRECTLILSSIPRINYLKKRFSKKQKYRCVKNFPTNKQINFDFIPGFDPKLTNIIKNEKYFFCNGNINNNADFLKICEYANKEKIYILIATHQIKLLESFRKNFPKIIINIGYLELNFMSYLISKCFAGICFYDNKDINQELSASTKLLEYLCFSKPVIVSNNYGIEYETAQLLNNNFCININNINKLKQIDFKEYKLNNSYIFENNYNRMMKKDYYICNRCVMDTSVKEIYIDNYSCNFCSDFNVSYSKFFGKNKNDNLDQLITKIKETKKINKAEYDCIIGVSGGVDSSWVLVKAVEKGLKPLAVHVDNGWNSELAQNNIANLVTKLKVDLFTKVIDWEEYKSLMKSFFAANVIDIELLYDNAIFAETRIQAKKNKIKFILSGTNYATEGLKMPKGWNWHKFDKKNIFDINNKFFKTKINTYPSMGTYDYVKFHLLHKIKWISFLDYFEYDKFESINILKEKFDFKPYPYKHYESVFTRFYQGYILPKKFNVDKRRVHLSNLILTNKISRKEALDELQNHPYHLDDLNSDKNYFLKKMDWSEEDLNNYLSKPEIKHDFYKSENNLWDYLAKIYRYSFYRHSN